jgi:hypothetical protein
MNKPMKYQVALVSREDATIYRSTALFATDNFEALQKTKEWIASLAFVAEDACVNINLNGTCIQSLPLGEV